MRLSNETVNTSYDVTQKRLGNPIAILFAYKICYAPLAHINTSSLNFLIKRRFRLLLKWKII